MRKVYTSFLLYFAIAFAAARPSLAVESEDWLLNGPPEFVGMNNWGSEFCLTVPPALEEQGAGHENVVKLYITSVADSKVKIEVPAKGFSETISVMRNATVDFELAPAIAQPYLKSGYYPSSQEELFKKTGIHIESSDLISVYVVVRYKNISEGYCALPVSSLGNSYVVSSYEDATAMNPSYNSLPSICGIVAAYDNTKVTFTLAKNENTQTSAGLTPGDSSVKYLSKGDLWMISSKGNGADLSGSLINADKPVAVLSGNQCANIPLLNAGSGYLAEMEQPVRAWGKAFHIPRVFGRKKGPILRVFAVSPDTKVYLNGYALGTLNATDGSTPKCFIETRGMIDNGNNSVITANHPVSITMYNTGSAEDGSPEPPGAPFQMVLAPTDQYQAEIEYAIPGNQLGMKFDYNYINIVYELEPNGMPSDSIRLGIVNGDNVIWQMLSQISSVTYEKFRVQADGKDYGMAIIKMPAYGQFRLKSPRPIMAYVYGFSENGSYGMPASICTREVNKSDKSAPVPTWKTDCDGTVSGTVVDMPDDPAGRSNLTDPIYGSVVSYNYDKEFSQIIPGQTSNANFTLRVREKDKDARAMITFRDLADNDTSVVIEYRAPKISALPAYHDFGFVKKNTVVYKDIELKNETTEPVRLSKAGMKYGNQGFSVEAVPQTDLAPGQTVTAKVKFQSPVKGKFTDSLGCGNDCVYFFKAKLEATTGSSEINVSDPTFGDVTVGTTDSATVKINNTGMAELVITSFVDFADKQTFRADFGRAITPSEPLIIPSQGSFLFKVFFTPSVEKEFHDKLIFSSDADLFDSIAVIDARSVKPGLLSKSYDWGRKRIYRQDYPSGPYPGDDEIIKLENAGSKAVIVASVLIEEDQHGSAFRFDKSKLENLTLDPGESVTVPVDFFPTELGEHSLVIAYIDNAGNKHNTRTRLAGTGVAPMIAPASFSFDTTLINAPYDVRSRMIRISNLGSEEWPKADTLKITGFESAPAGAISFGDEKGTAGFKIDTKNIDLPLVIPPGDFIDLPAEFSAQKEGLNSAILVIKSDAYTPDQKNAAIPLSGIGMTRVVSFEDGEASTCIFTCDTIVCRLKNNGSKPVNIKSLSFENIEEEFSFADPELTGGFPIEPKSSKDIKIVFRPKAKVDKTVKLVAETDEAKGDLVKATAMGRTLLVSRSLSLNPVSRTATVGENVDFRLIMESGENIRPFSIKEFKVTVDHGTSWLIPLLDKIELGTGLQGHFEIVDGSIMDDGGSLSMAIKSIAGEAFDLDGEIVKIPMYVALPETDESKANVSISLSGINTTCVSVAPAESRISILPVCGGLIRRITTSGVKYALAPVLPNPVDGRGTEVKFSIGIDGPVSIRIYNASGTIVATPVDEVLNAGTYGFTLPVRDMSSGVYFIRLISGPFTATERVMIAK